jgi:DNA-binding CsgD family transcriptional regulator
MTDASITSATLVSISKKQTLTVLGSFGVSSDLLEEIEGESLWSSSHVSRCLRSGDVTYSTDDLEVFGTLGKIQPNATDSGTTIKLASIPIVLQEMAHGCLVVGFAAEELSRTLKLTLRSICKLLALYLHITNAGDERKHKDANEEEQSSIQLSARQETILSLMAAGLTTKQMALKLGYSSSTIHQDIILTYKILGVHSRREALGAARDLGLHISAT